MTTKEKISEAAARVFTQRGFASTTTRDIAELAGINVATLHYHHRSKEELFTTVARESMAEFVTVMDDMTAPGLTLEDRVHTFVDGCVELFRRRPYLATFCLVESERDPETFRQIVDFNHCYQIIRADLERLHAAKHIRQMSPSSFITAMVGMTIYPFITKRTVLGTADFQEADFHQFLEVQKTVIPEMILGYLRR